MPTTRRYSARRRSPGVTPVLTTWQRWALTSAGPSYGAVLAQWPADDPEIWREGWEQHRETLLAEYIAENPGMRPWPWWIFEHCQERPIINPAPPAVEAQFRKHGTIFGFLIANISHGHGASGGGLVPWLEPETDYLERMGLLTDSEIAILEAERAAVEADDDIDDDELTFSSEFSD
jgi:hypothetical protein